MTRLARGFLRLILRVVDVIYHWRHKSEPVGPMMLVNESVHDGPDKVFADGTLVKQGDIIGAIHFDNRVTSRLASHSSRAAALRFVRLLRESLAALAQKAANEPVYARYPAYVGITWLPPHGVKMGFETEPMPEGGRRRYLTRFFRLLVWVVAPAQETRDSANPEPIVFWMTRKQLLAFHLKPEAEKTAS